MVIVLIVIHKVKDIFFFFAKSINISIIGIQPLELQD
jgi:hypothetical protein